MPRTLLILAVFCGVLGLAAKPPMQTKVTFKSENRRNLSIEYLLYLPEKHDADKETQWPLLIFLHGAGERGDNIERVKVHGPPKLIEKGRHFPFIVVSPQCPRGQVWDTQTLDAMLDDLLKKHRIDTTRLYLTGLSMGGYGSWSWGIKQCDRFAAIAPICGGGNFIKTYNAAGAKGAALRSLGIWAFHGGRDTVVPPGESERMIASLKKFGHPNPKLTLYPKARHDSWTVTYDNPELYEWFLKHQRK